MASIPLVDLKAAHVEIADEVAEGFAEVLATTGFVGGPRVAQFEAAFAQYSEVNHCIGVGNGTDALEIAFRTLGIGSGDEVIVPANTFVASAEGVVRAGAKAVFADVTQDGLLDPEAAKAAITPRTAALLPVHLTGQMADMAAVQKIADHHGLAVVEDAAQSHGARQGGRASGSFGTMAATSFYPGKNLGAYGDAGGVLTDDPELAHKARMIANHGSATKYEHEVFGFNSRLDALQAVVLTAKLQRLEANNERRRAAANRYADLLSGVAGVRAPREIPGNVHVWHLYMVQVEDRDRVLADLNAQGIGAGIHYPIPLHLLGPYTESNEPGQFPVAENLADRILSLPLFPQITPDQQEQVVAALADAVARD